MSIHRNCEVHQKSHIQRGRGVGGVLRSLYSQLIPVAKYAGEKVLACPEAKSTLEAIKNASVDAGLNIIVDKVKKRNVGKVLKTNLTNAKHEIEDAVKTNVRKAVKRTVGGVFGQEDKRAKHDRDVFDDISLDDDDEDHGQHNH